MGSIPRLSRLTLCVALLGTLTFISAFANAQCDQGQDEQPPTAFQCPPGIPLTSDTFHQLPLMDGDGRPYPPMNGALHVERVNLYGIYGNDESQPGAANNHFVQGVNEGMKIVPRCTDGSTATPCSDGKAPVIVFLFIGFSNCTLEICGGRTDIWAGLDTLPGQPCATSCLRRFPTYSLRIR